MITPKSLCGFRDLRSVEILSRSGLGPIRVHYKNWADQGHSVGYPTVDDTIDESRLEAHLCNPPSGLKFAVFKLRKHRGVGSSEDLGLAPGLPLARLVEMFATACL